MAARLFDSHCHLYMEEFADDASDALARAAEAGVRRAMLIGCDEASSREAIACAQNFAQHGVALAATVGVHPHEAGGVKDGLPDSLKALASDDSVRAIGEIGLDYYYDNSPRGVQAEVFERQIAWAREAGLPIVVHLRNAANPSDGDAASDARAIIRRAGAEECGGVIHCFSGGIAEARAMLDLGFYISFAGPVTYPKNNELREAAAYAPADRILCETDSPYLAPQKKRGKRNEPALVRHIYEKIADVRGVSLACLAQKVWQNGAALFRLTG